MKILITNNATHLLPAKNYGGTERVIWYLGKELAKMGHHITYLAAKGSQCDFGNIIEMDGDRPVEEQIPEGFDIVHFNARLKQSVNTPYIVTIHGNSKHPDTFDLNSVFVSRDHAERHHSDSFVYNGLDWDDYGKVSLDNPRHYYHFLGKASWSVKNVQGTINVVKALPGEKLYVLGGNRFALKGVRFTLTPKAHFCGMVGGEEKLRLLQGSKGLIFPVKWHEPFGLAVTESLYFGAPVFGTPYGALPELVAPEVGYLTNNQGEMIRHIQEAEYNSKVCHEYARDLFNSKIMAEQYLAKYEQVLNGGTLNKEQPYTSIPREKLPWIK